jgi:hypothetical protein
MPNPAISGVKERDQAVHEPPHLYIGGLAGRRDLASNNLIGNKCIPVFLGRGMFACSAMLPSTVRVPKGPVVI